MRELRNDIGEEIKECCIFNPPRRLFCWNGLETPVEMYVSAVALCYYGLVAVTFDGEMFSHCATIGKPIDLKEADDGND
jgi:hypothetical protein